MIAQATVELPHADRDANPPVSIYLVHPSSPAPVVRTARRRDVPARPRARAARCGRALILALGLVPLLIGQAARRQAKN